MSSFPAPAMYQLDQVDFYDHVRGHKYRRGGLMQFTETVIRQDPWDVEPRLKELGLTASGLCRVRDVAQMARSNMTANHANNAPGTYAYQDGTWCLRDEFIGELWKKETPGGVQAIVNYLAKARIAFANVDRACDVNHNPVSISSKGSGAERLCETNLFERLPTFTREQAGSGFQLFYCMVDADGRVELSRPTIVGRAFGPCVERNFIALGGDDDTGTRISITPLDDTAVDLTPIITRKAA